MLLCAFQIGRIISRCDIEIFHLLSTVQVYLEKF